MGLEAASTTDAFSQFETSRNVPQFREIDTETGFISFDAIRGIQGGREFYTGMCSFSTLYSHFKLKDPQIPPEMRAQRKLRPSRVPRIRDYILNNPNDYVFSAITVSVGGRLHFFSAPGLGQNARMGTLRMSIDAPILINDGQHRYKAICEAYDRKPELRSEKIPVVFFEDIGLRRSQQMFADLNINAVKPTRSLGLLYDHRDPFSRFVVNMVNDVEIFVGRTELEKTNISHRSRMFLTLHGIAEATRYLLKLNTKSVPAKKQQAAVDFWRTVSDSIPEWKLLIRGKITPYELRKNYVHAHTNALSAIGIAGHILLTHYPDSWAKMAHNLRKVDWARNASQWEGKLLIDGRMIKNKTGIKAAAGLILAYCGVKESLDSFGVRW